MEKYIKIKKYTQVIGITAFLISLLFLFFSNEDNLRTIFMGIGELNLGIFIYADYKIKKKENKKDDKVFIILGILFIVIGIGSMVRGI